MLQKIKDKVSEIVVESKNEKIDKNINQFFGDLQKEMDLQEQENQLEEVSINTNKIEKYKNSEIIKKEMVQNQNKIRERSQAVFVSKQMQDIVSIRLGDSFSPVDENDPELLEKIRLQEEDRKTKSQKQFEQLFMKRPSVQLVINDIPIIQDSYINESFVVLQKENSIEAKQEIKRGKFPNLAQLVYSLMLPINKFSANNNQNKDSIQNNLNKSEVQTQNSNVSSEQFVLVEQISAEKNQVEKNITTLMNEIGIGEVNQEIHNFSQDDLEMLREYIVSMIFQAQDDQESTNDLEDQGFKKQNTMEVMQEQLFDTNFTIHQRKYEIEKDNDFRERRKNVTMKKNKNEKQKIYDSLKSKIKQELLLIQFEDFSETQSEQSLVQPPNQDKIQEQQLQENQQQKNEDSQSEYEEEIPKIAPPFPQSLLKFVPQIPPPQIDMKFFIPPQKCPEPLKIKKKKKDKLDIFLSKPNSSLPVPFIPNSPSQIPKPPPPKYILPPLPKHNMNQVIDSQNEKSSLTLNKQSSSSKNVANSLNIAKRSSVENNKLQRNGSTIMKVNQKMKNDLMNKLNIHNQLKNEVKKEVLTDFVKRNQHILKQINAALNFRAPQRFKDGSDNEESSSESSSADDKF